MPQNAPTDSDEELMMSYQAGAITAFETLFQRHSGRVMGFLAKRLRNERDAHDLLQEVFFKLHRSKHQYNGTLPFSPWLFSITRSVLLDHAKKRNLEDPTDARVLDAFAVHDEAEGRQSSELSGDALGLLTPAQAKAISFRIYDEESFEEIATRLATTPQNARQLVSRGLKRLREAVGTKKV